ncbi:MAG: UDP-N-acetylglucosamine 2-epimerase (non-hydrolyzing) [Bacilli bacterium]|jgi:UDP-N-acetylglucosamine 2-epimerase (non-hydrolysing)|nr:UDP-N-acetylglucosamine 2-epimerase (non-hydrolyzing) [Bacilli bacterium]
MPKKFKLMTIIGTRPEIIRLSQIIKKADMFFDHILVHTGQNYDHRLKDIFFEDLNLRTPDYFLEINKENLGTNIGSIIASAYEVMEKEKPDAVLILGDTNSALSSIIAKRLHIPLFHMEAGNRTVDWNVPEMTNRMIVDHISDINLPYTERARRNLIHEGIDDRYIFVVGSPMAEVINSMRDKISHSAVLSSLNIEKGAYFLFDFHREENVDDAKTLDGVVASIEAVAKKYQLPIIVSLHPRTRKKINLSTKVFANPLIKIIEPLSFSDYTCLEMSAKAVISDSGTLAEEAGLLHFRGVLMRTSNERQEAEESGTVVLGGNTPDSILLALDMILSRDITLEIPSEYDYKDVSSRVVNLIPHYTRIINKHIYHK